MHKETKKDDLIAALLAIDELTSLRDTVDASDVYLIAHGALGCSNKECPVLFTGRRMISEWNDKQRSKFKLSWKNKND